MKEDKNLEEPVFKIPLYRILVGEYNKQTNKYGIKTITFKTEEEMDEYYKKKKGINTNGDD